MPEPAFGQHLGQRQAGGAQPVLEHHAHGDARSRAGFDDLGGGGQGPFDRLFQQHMFVRGGQLANNVQPGIGRRQHDRGVDAGIGTDFIDAVIGAGAEPGRNIVAVLLVAAVHAGQFDLAAQVGQCGEVGCRNHSQADHRHAHACSPPGLTVPPFFPFETQIIARKGLACRGVDFRAQVALDKNLISVNVL